MDLFFNRDCGVGAGPAVEDPSILPCEAEVEAVPDVAAVEEAPGAEVMAWDWLVERPPILNEGVVDGAAEAAVPVVPADVVGAAVLAGFPNPPKRFEGAAADCVLPVAGVELFGVAPKRFEVAVDVVGVEVLPAD
jgi:hypothetical protein